MLRTSYPISLAVAVLLVASWTTHAFTLRPISLTLNPKGNSAAGNFYVENDSSNRVAFQITMITREMDEHGKETYEPATNVFTVFPPQGVIPPGQRQNIRLLWKGPANLTSELAYRIVAEELPVATEEKGKDSHIKLLLRYMGTVYVTPKKASPQLQTVSLVRAEANSGSTNLYELTLRNSGNAHRGLVNPVLTLTNAPGQTTTLQGDELNSVAGQNILAQHTRRFPVVLPAEFKAPDYPAQIRVDE